MPARNLVFTDATRYARPGLSLRVRSRTPHRRAKSSAGTSCEPYGASLDDIVSLIRARTARTCCSCRKRRTTWRRCATRVGGSFARAPLPGRIHGLAMWSPVPWQIGASRRSAPVRHVVPPRLPGPRPRASSRSPTCICRMARCSTAASSATSRRSCRRTPPSSATTTSSDPALLPGFRDVGPRQADACDGRHRAVTDRSLPRARTYLSRHRLSCRASAPTIAPSSCHLSLPIAVTPSRRAAKRHR